MDRDKPDSTGESYKVWFFAGTETIDIILVKHKLAGHHNFEKAVALLSKKTA